MKRPLRQVSFYASALRPLVDLGFRPLVVYPAIPRKWFRHFTEVHSSRDAATATHPPLQISRTSPSVTAFIIDANFLSPSWFCSPTTQDWRRLVGVLGSREIRANGKAHIPFASLNCYRIAPSKFGVSSFGDHFMSIFHLLFIALHCANHPTPEWLNFACGVRRELPAPGTKEGGAVLYLCGE